MVAKWSGILSTTEPRNDIGILNVRQGNKNSEIAEFQIIENNKPYDLTGFTVLFCASFGLNQVEKTASVVNAKEGKISYTFDDDAMQQVGRNKGYFSIKKAEAIIDSTQEFEYRIQSSIYSRLIDAKSYIFRLNELMQLLEDFVTNSQTNFSTWFDSVKEILYGVDPGGNILRELIEARNGILGKVFPSLKARLDTFETETTAQFQQTELKLKIVNVIDFGAKGDGFTDDSLAFQSAIDAASYKVLVPPGDYVAKELKINKPILLYSFSPAKKRMQNNQRPEGVALIRTSGSDFADIGFSGTLEIENIYLLGNETSGVGKKNKGFSSKDHPFYVETKNVFIDSFGMGIDFSNQSWLQKVTNAKIQNCDIGIYAPNAANKSDFSDNDFQYNRIDILAIGQVVIAERNHFGFDTNITEACVIFKGSNPGFRDNYFEAYRFSEGVPGLVNGGAGTYPFKFIGSNLYINVGEVVNNDIDGKSAIKHGFYFENEDPDDLVIYRTRFDQNKITRLLGQDFKFTTGHKIRANIDSMYSTNSLYSNSFRSLTKESGFNSRFGIISDKNVTIIELTKETAILCFSAKIPSRSGIVAIGVNGQASVLSGPYFKQSNKILTGSSEVGFMHVSYVNNIVYVENQLGVAFDYTLTILG